MPSSRRRFGRRRSERGAALIEAAFVAPIFFALLLAAIEGGFVFYERLSVSNMSLAGARSASGQGSETWRTTRRSSPLPPASAGRRAGVSRAAGLFTTGRTAPRS